MNYKKSLLYLTILFSHIIYAQGIYTHPNFDKISKNHKIIAIIPFKTKIILRPNQMKKITFEDVKKMEENTGISTQKLMYSWFLKRKSKGKLMINIQPPITTNQKLEKAGVNYNKYETFAPQKIAEILGVDAVIIGNLETTKPMSDGAAITLIALTGLYGVTISVTVNFSLYNGSDGEVMMNFYKRYEDTAGGDNNVLIKALMRKASKKMPYIKK